MEYRGISDVALVTNDMDKTVRFYRDVLGMRVAVTFAGEIGGQRIRHYFFGLGPTSCLSFFEWPAVKMPGRKDAGIPESGRQFDHVSIGVDSETSLLEIQQRVRAAGIEASDVVDHGFARVIYFEDPNGISLAFTVWTQDLEQKPFLFDDDPVPALQEADEHRSPAP